MDLVLTEAYHYYKISLYNIHGNSFQKAFVTHTLE